jgi:hypothetical protein
VHAFLYATDMKMHVKYDFIYQLHTAIAFVVFASPNFITFTIIPVFGVLQLLLHGLSGFVRKFVITCDS